MIIDGFSCPIAKYCCSLFVLCNCTSLSLMLIFYCRAILPDFIPQVGMEFGSSDEAWAFWLRYGGHRGFEVRKRYTNKRPTDGKVQGPMCGIVLDLDISVQTRGRSTYRSHRDIWRSHISWISTWYHKIIATTIQHLIQSAYKCLNTLHQQKLPLWVHTTIIA